jgi:5-hydroxyisourate hydrolase
MSAITTHVLDTSRGAPAVGVDVTLEVQESAGWRVLGRGRTDADGRLRDLLPAGAPPIAAVYRLTFDSGAYFAAQHVATFYPTVVVTFTVAAGQSHYHVPLLLAPFGYSTYRGT